MAGSYTMQSWPALTETSFELIKANCYGTISAEAEAEAVVP